MLGVELNLSITPVASAALRAAPQIRLPLPSTSWPPLRGARMWPVYVRIGYPDRSQISFGGKRQHALIADRAFRERPEPDAAVHEAGGQRYGTANFAA